MTEFAITAADTAQPVGTLRARNVDGVVISDVAAEPHTAQHIPDERSGQSVSMISVQITGTARMVFSDHSVLMRPGDVGVFHSSQPGTVIASSGYGSVCLTIPQHAVDVPLDELSGVVVPADKGVAPAFSSLLVSIRDTLDTVPAALRPRLFRSAVELGTALILDELGSPSEPDHRSRMRLAMYCYIEDNLSDPELDVNRLAHVHHLSVRHVHNIFRQGGDSAAARIRSRRIERARQDLANARQLDIPVATIAARWGFTSASHFGQLFKSVVGCTPASYRDAVAAAN